MPNARIFCIAKLCYNYQPAPGAPTFFNLPTDPQSRSTWIENAGRMDLKEKTVSNLSGKYFICADHFEAHCFMDPSKKSVLRKDTDVVPTIFKSNLSSLVSMDSCKIFRDSQSTLAGSEMAEVESAQEILNAAVVHDDVLDTSEWTNIVAVSLGDDGSLMCDTINSPSQVLPESSVTFASESNQDSDEMVMECLMLCRLCAALVQVSMLVPVFGEEADSSVQNMMNRVIPGQVLIDDGLPQRVCTTCVARLRSCCEILDSFKAADTRLRQMVELCNLDQANNERDDRMALQDNGLPIILQTVGETPGEELDGVTNTINPVYQEDESLQTVVPHSILLHSRQTKKEDQVEDLSTEECINISNSVNNFRVHEEDCLNFEEAHQFECGICHEVYAQQTDLVSHFINFHAIKVDDEPSIIPDNMNSTFQCSICKDVLGDEDCLQNHKFSQTGGAYECSACKKTSTDKNDVDSQYSEVHKRKGLLKSEDSEEPSGHKCDVCGKEFKSTIALRKHRGTHTGERTVLCSLCGKTLANLNSLRVHMRIHSEDRPFTCSECGKSFKGPTELRSHSVTHSREKIHNCPQCGRKFHSKGLVRQHMLSHTHDKPHKCNMCTASFNRLGNLNQHKKKHMDQSVAPAVSPFECNACGKRFQSKLTLKYHLAKHTGDKYPFDCEICGKKFIAIDPYRVHMRVHTGERPFECEVCKKTFRSSATLKQHIASLHRDDYPYGCPYCQRSFKRLQSLIVHKKTHTGEKPWLCSQCGRAFAQKGDMIKHTKTHRPHVEEEEIIMEVDTIDDLALDNEISKIIFG